MKIAFITNDGKTISQHFGRASHYLVVDVEDGEIKNKELREKMGHNQFAHSDEHHDHTQGSGMDKASHSKHNLMAKAISDCDVLICGGMGRGAYISMQSFDITPLVTDYKDIEKALQVYLAGDLKDQTDKLH